MTVGGRMIGRLPSVSSTFRPGKRPFASTYPEATPVIPAITVAGEGDAQRKQERARDDIPVGDVAGQEVGHPNPSPKPTSSVTAIAAAFCCMPERSARK